MKVVICGAGQVGHSLARYLSQADNDITIIDSSQESIDILNEQLDVQTIIGHPCQPDVMRNAGTNEADLLIAVTSSDEVNMVACEVAHTIFNVPTKIARIRDQSYLDPEWASLFIARNIGIDHIISPEVEIAKTIQRNINISGSFEVQSLGNNQLLLVGIKALGDSLILHTPLKLLSSILTQTELNIILIIRHDQIIFPQEDDAVIQGDEVYFICHEPDISKIIQAFGYYTEPFKRVVIIGGGNIGRNLASFLDADFPYLKTKVIEREKKQAQLLCEKFINTVVIHGNALDNDILQEANVGGSEIVVSVTDDDKVNILASLLGKKLGAKRTLALINSSNFNALTSSLGVDGIINPRSITISSILHHLSHGRIKSVHSLKDGIAEIIEGEVTDTSPIAGCFVKKVNVQNVFNIIAIIREGDVILAISNLSIKTGDRVLMIVSSHSTKRAEKLFTSRTEYIF
jgi:trk system potassium uptake protein TrkA